MARLIIPEEDFEFIWVRSIEYGLSVLHWESTDGTLETSMKGGDRGRGTLTSPESGVARIAVTFDLVDQEVPDVSGVWEWFAKKAELFAPEHLINDLEYCIDDDIILASLKGSLGRWIPKQLAQSGVQGITLDGNPCVSMSVTVPQADHDMCISASIIPCGVVMMATVRFEFSHHEGKWHESIPGAKVYHS